MPSARLHLLPSAVILAMSVAGHSPAMAAECGPLKRIAALDLIELPSGRPAISATLNDTKQTLLVDTGGALSMLTKRTVREMHLTTANEGHGVSLVNVEGLSSQLMAEVPSLTIGTVHQTPAYFYVDPAKDDTSDKVKPEYAGALAPDFLHHFDVDFDFAGKRLNLFSPDHCDSKVIYWDAPVAAAIPFRLISGGKIVFPVQLDGKTLDAELDTGAVNTTVNLNTARHLFGLDTHAADVEKIGKLTGRFSEDVYRKRFTTLALNGVTISNPAIILLPDLVTPADPRPFAAASVSTWDGDKELALPDMLLGMSILSRLHIYIAYNERKLYVSAASTDTAQPSAR